MLSTLLLGCPKGSPAPVDWAATPQLPSPSAGTYSRVQAKPTDRGVQHALGGRAWDASLGGTAAGLALSLVTQPGTLTPQEVREAAWRAGWPFPLRSVHSAWGPTMAPPPPSMQEHIRNVPANVDLGLVRARGDQQDVWVLVTSQPKVDLGSIPRQLALGSVMRLPAVGPGTTFTAASPTGEVSEGHLELGWSTETNIAGEWLIEIREGTTRVALFPVYVGVPPPTLSLLPTGEAPQNGAVAERRAKDLLTQVREAYNLNPPGEDPMLQGAVPWAMANATGTTAPEIARRVGVDASDLWRLDCRAATVEACLDQILWDPAARPALLANRVWWGAGATVNSDGVRMLLILSRN